MKKRFSQEQIVAVLREGQSLDLPDRFARSSVQANSGSIETCAFGGDWMRLGQPPGSFHGPAALRPLLGSEHGAGEVEQEVHREGRPALERPAAGRGRGRDVNAAGCGVGSTIHRVELRRRRLPFAIQAAATAAGPERKSRNSFTRAGYKIGWTAADGGTGVFISPASHRTAEAAKWC